MVLTVHRVVAADLVGRDAAREAARRELSKPPYHRDDPNLVERILRRIVEWVTDTFDRASAHAPGGSLGLVGLVVLLALIVVAIRVGTGPLSRGGRAGAVFGGGQAMTADEHRRRADEHAAAGRFAEAVRERLRAVVRELEFRGVLEARPGRTADEVAHEAGAALPALAADLRRGALLFDDIWYGGRPATESADAELRALDDRVRAARPTAAVGPAPGPLSVPR